MNFSRLLNFFVTHEIKLFYVLVLLNLLPLFSGSFFPTLDGPAHLYNSKLLLELFGNTSTTVNKFYELNDLVPNLSGHTIIALFLTFLPPYLAEKMFLIIYVVSLPLSFRYLLKSTHSGNVLFSYFILPFVYSYLFLLGFYNFSISLVFLFLTIGYWFKFNRQKTTIQGFVLLSLLSFSVFISHLLIFGLMLIFLFGNWVITLLRLYFVQKKNNRFILISGTKKLAILLVTNLIPLIFAFIYFLKRPQTGSNYSFLTCKEKISYIVDFRPLIAFNYEIELNYTKWLFNFFVVLILVWLLIGTKQILHKNSAEYKKENQLIRLINHRSAFAAITCIISLMAFLLLPDSDGYGSYISVRMALLFLIFLIYFFANVINKKGVAIIFIPAIIYITINLNIYYSEVSKSLNPVANELVGISTLLTKNSIIMPINVSENWIFGHFSNYLGVLQPMIILENYEANSGYFPVNWKGNERNFTFPSEDLYNCTGIDYRPLIKEVVYIDYIFILGSLDKLDQNCREALDGSKQYETIYESNSMVLIKIHSEH